MIKWCKQKNAWVLCKTNILSENFAKLTDFFICLAKSMGEPFPTICGDIIFPVEGPI